MSEKLRADGKNIFSLLNGDQNKKLIVGVGFGGRLDKLKSGKSVGIEKK